MAKQLTHWGVLGMKWGRRKSRSSGPSSEDHTTTRAIQKKRVDEMSNAELKKVNERLQLERQFKDLSKKEIGAGRKIMNDLLAETGKSIAKGYINKYLTQKNIDAFVSLIQTKIKKG